LLKNIGKKMAALKGKTKKSIFVVSALIVPIVHFIIFWVAVNFNSLLLGFQRLNFDTGKNYFTFANFKDIPALFGRYGDLRIALYNTLLTWVFLAVFLLPWAFFLTYFLYKRIRLSSFWRTMLFIPSILPAVAMTSIFMYFIMPDAPVGKVIGAINGGRVPAFINDVQYARWTVIFYIFLTNFGGQFILFSGAMVRVPKEVVESAYLDGAGVRTEMLRIILPLCWPTISMLFILNLATLFTASGPVLLLTGGLSETSTIAFWIFNSTRSNSLYMPAAVGVMLTLILFPVVMLARWGLEKIYSNVEF